MKTKKLTYSKMLKILKEARHALDVDFIKLNIDDFYDLVEEGKLVSGLDLVNQRNLQKLGLHAHLYGFGIYCSIDLGSNRYCLGKVSKEDSDPDNSYRSMINIEWSEPQNI